MGLITGIEQQKNRKDRKSIFVDGGFLAGVHSDVVSALGLAVGQVVDEKRLNELLRAESVRKAREKALSLLSYRDRSTNEIRRRLIRSDFATDVVEEVVEQFSSSGLLDDEKFSRDWISSRQASKPAGRARLSEELRSKGIRPEVVNDALASLDPEREKALAREAAARKLGKLNMDDQSWKRKLISFLSRRGFDWDTIRDVVGEIDPANED